MTTDTTFSTIDYSNVTLNHSAIATSAMPISIRIVILICMILIDISAFLGNVLVICAFFRTRRLQTVTNYFIASLAFADALVATFVLPLSIYYYQRDRSWKLGLILCDLWVSSDVLLCTSSILNLTCISVDRYMAITRPLTYAAYRSKFLAQMMILLVWIVSAVITCPPIFGWRDKNRRQTVEEEFRCDLNSARSYVVYSALGSFYIPGVVMIFVYIRIFMVVYDRENLINKFHDDQTSSISLKSTPNSLIHTEEAPKKKNTCPNFFSCCCCCFRRTPSSRTPAQHYSFGHCSNIEQKQNGYLVYRFTNNNNINNNNNYTSNPNSSVYTTPSNSKSSICCHPCGNSQKKINRLSDEYRRNCLAHIAAEYQFRTDESPCYELKTLENSLPPLVHCRSRSFEQPTTSKIRDLNTELSHSRQLKAAAAVAAAAVTISTKDNELKNLVISDQEADGNQIFSSIDETFHDVSQSLDELTQLSIVPNAQRYKKNSPVKASNFIPMRQRATTNPSILLPVFSSSPTYSYISKQKQSLPEPTRINRRNKSSRLVPNSPSTLLIENFKQQHRITRNSSIRSTQSARSLASVRRFTNGNDHNLNENHLNPNSSFWRYCCCCCYAKAMKHINQNKTKRVFTYTPNHSLTNDDDDDEKISSNDTSNRTPLYTPVHSSSIPRVNSSSNGTPGDVNRRERIRFMKEQKTAKTLSIVVGGFILCWLPFFIMYVIPEELHGLNAHTVTLITWLGYCNSVINPFIYAYCSKQFRMAFWNITFGVCMKKSSVLLPMNSQNKQSHHRRINA